MNQVNPSAVRARAGKALRGHWQPLLVIALIASLPQLAEMVFKSRFASESILPELMQMLDVQSLDQLDLANFRLLLERWATGAARTNMLLSAVVYVLSTMLSVSAVAAVMQRLHGGEPTLAVYGQTARLWLKALIVAILTAVKVMLWGLLGAVIGAAVIFVGGLIARSVGSTFAYLLITLSSLPSLILSVRAIFRFMLAPSVLADAGCGALEALRESKRLMKDRLFTLFCTQFYWILFFCLGLLATNFLAPMLGGVITDVIWLFIQLALTVYSYALNGAFYLEALPLTPNAGSAKTVN